MQKGTLLRNVTGDIMGGMMTVVVALPVAMAFGVASGMGAAAGLYGAMAAGMFAAIFGGTKGQQSGPTGPIAVIVASLLASNGQRPEIVFAATIVGGIFQILFGKVGAGRLINYVPYPTVSGFMTGIAVIIIVMHIHPLFGLHGPKKIIECLVDLPRIAGEYNSTALTLGLITCVLALTLKRFAKRLPGTLIALLVATAISVLMKADVPRIGEIPSQLPLPMVPMIGLGDLMPVMLGGLTIAVLGSIDSLLTSLIADKLLQTRHNSDKELVGQGIGNIVAGLIGGIPGAGSTTRTLANIDAGGRTALSGVVYSLLVVATIAGLGKFAALIPLSALAAILIMLGVGIVDWRMMKHLKVAPREDVLVMLSVLIMTVFVDLISAVLFGTALACVLFVRRMSTTDLCSSGTIRDFEEFAPLCERLPAGLHGKVFVYKLGQPLYFGGANKLRSTLEAQTEAKVVLIYSPMKTFIDQSACYTLEEIISKLSAAGTEIYFVGLCAETQQTLRNMACLQAASPDRWFDSMEEAMAHLAGPGSTPQPACSTT
jgi:sulfate permease, SulP family